MNWPKTHTQSKTLSAALFMVMALLAQDVMAFEYVQSCGNNGGYTWSPNQLPLAWKMNRNGSDDMPVDRVEEIFKTSFATWSAPCCSRFTSTFAGRTSNTALSNNGEVVLSFQETSWPRELGDPNGGVIAVTLLNFGSGCRIIRAPIVYNGIAHRFTDQCNATGCANQGTDLEGVTTHEIGHLLGLDHSPVRSATMYFAYQGGNGARSLHSDDTAGVCDLYPGVCSCTRNEDCTGEREQCVNQRCEFIPCTSDSQCEQDLVCNRNTGKCGIPPCANDAECSEGFQCINTKCVSTCPICRECTSSNQCGANGTCVDFNGDRAGECISFCEESTGICPGDSACYQVPIDGETYFLCLNPNVQSAGVCPESYVCDGTVMRDPCDNVQCPAGQQCQGGRCVNDPTSCANINCASGKVCVQGECVADPNDCRNINCTSGKVCMNGQCVSMPEDDMASFEPDMSADISTMDDVFVVITPPNNNQKTGTNSVCTSTPISGHAPGQLTWLLLGLVGWFWRKRR